MIRDIKISDKDSYYELGLLITDNFKTTNKLDNIINSEYNKIKVFEQNQKILGFIEYTLLEDEVDIVNLVVDKNHRNQKIATNLMVNLINETKREKYVLEVKSNNHIARNLYKSLGFIDKGIRKGYYNGIDAITMVKELWKKMFTY